MQQSQEDQTPGAQPASQPSTRRDFLKAAGTTAAGVVAASLAGPAREVEAAQTNKKAVIPTPKADTRKFMGGKYPRGPVMATGRAIGANDRVSVAFVGLGGQGSYHMRNFADTAQDRNTQTIGISDVYLPRMDSAKKYTSEKTGVTNVMTDKDYRRLLDNKDIDAIVISTPEHWHGQIAVHAMEAGKHVYIEKPMTRYLDEAFQVHDAAVRTKRVVQVGSQGCSDVRWHAAGEAVRAGRIGPIVMGQGSYARNSSTGEWNYPIDAGANPDNLDWQMWLGSAPSMPWSTTGGAGSGEQPNRDDAAARFFRYRKYWDYSGGILGDLMPHKLHPFLIASGNPQYPSRVMSVGTRSVSTDREVMDTVQVMADFPSGWSMLFVGSTVNEQGLPDMIRGHKATIYFGNSVEIRPERPYAEEIEGGNVALDTASLKGYAPNESVPAHESDWLLAIRTGKTPNCNIDLATKVQTIVSLAEMSQRANKAMIFDEKTRKITAG